MNKITTFIIDIGKVLLYFDHKIITGRLSKISKYSQDEIHAFMFDAKFINQFEKGKISEKEFYRRVCRKLGITVSFDKFKMLFSDIFTPNPSLHKVIRKLKGKYRLCIFSNTDKTHYDYLYKKYPFMRTFDSYYLSYKIGAMKPELKMFRTLLKKEKVKPQECVYIDDIAKYTDAAKKLGINTFQYKSTSQFLKDLKTLNIHIK
ncbi:MAG: hypothetical protein A2252_06545 [Elusimicrobia bacterium RIFOXYA2_FULL_39_19]|nr:MAG: hypothetical protein A2252_06545 [Elusimicrobia bacterium RIFOXYA2_FULL_39_19]